MRMLPLIWVQTSKLLNGYKYFIAYYVLCTIYVSGNKTEKVPSLGELTV